MLRQISAVLMLLMCGISVAGGQTTGAQATRISYGAASTSFGELLVPSSGGRFPVTFRDLSDATDFVRELGRTYPLDPQRVVVVGHSSGGYLGAWLAGRHRLPTGSPFVGPSPLKVSGAVLLDAFLDPRVIDSRGVDGRLFCDEPVLPRLIGGVPDSVPDQLRQASPLALLPFDVPQEYAVSSFRLSGDAAATAGRGPHDPRCAGLPGAGEEGGRFRHRSDRG